MKKFLLITLMVAMLLGVFAVCAFAADDSIIVSKTVDEEYGTIIQLSADPGLDDAAKYVSTLNKINDAGTDKDALCIITDGAETPSYYVFPASYIVLESENGVFNLTASDLAAAVAEFNTAKGTKYYESYSTYSSGGSKRFNGIVRFEFTSDVTTVNDGVCCMRSYSTLKEVRFNYEISIPAGDMFKGSSSLVTIVGFENVDATNIGHATFMGCTSLETVSLPTDIVRIPSSMFWGCKKITITNLAECTQLTTIGSSAFQDTSYLRFVLPDTVTTIEKSAFQSAFKDGDGGSFTIGKNSQLVTIGDSAFEDCRKMPASIYIPSTVKSIGTNAFIKCYTLETLENFENCQITEIKDGTFSYVTNLKSIKIPETVTTIGSAFADNNYLTLVYIPKTVETMASTFTGGKPTTALFIYTGDDLTIFAEGSKLAGANKIQASEYDENTTYSGINLVVGYSHCVAYHGGVHGNTVIKSYEFTSYYEPVVISNMCQDCGMSAPETQIPAIFECLGYSTPEDGREGLAIGFTLDKEALAEYEETTGKALNYGVFAILKDRLGDNDVFAQDGTAIEGSINADITSYEFVAFELRIEGFIDEYKDVKLAMGAYVAETDGETTKYSYLQAGTPAENEKYCFVSYNDVATAL